MDPIVYSLLSGAIGAIIGTFCGAYLIILKQDKVKRTTRKMAIKAINLFSKYAKKEGTFNLAEQEFNSCISLAEKRTILVALHKLGIPVIVKPDSDFSIEKISFDCIKIDRDELTAISNQIEKGLCDHLFYTDPEAYFKEGIRLSSLRFLAKRWTREVLFNSSFDKETNTVYYPNNWFEKYSWGEKLALAVFKVRVSLNEYFDEEGKIAKSKIDQLLKEIARRLWDNCLCWDIEAYQNIQSANNLNNQFSTFLQAQKEETGQSV